MTNPTDLIDRSNGRDRFLRRALIADAAISGTTGLLMLLGAGVLQEMLGMPRRSCDTPASVFSRSRLFSSISRGATVSRERASGP